MVSDSAVGKTPEDLSLSERFRLAGRFMALEIYSPATLPMRRIQAVGATAEECARTLQARGLDPRKFEFLRMQPPF